MLCSLFPIKDSSDYFYNTVYLAGVLQASWQTADGTLDSKRFIYQVIMDCKTS